MKNFLGQNFLINKNKIKKIIDTLELEKNDVVVEIGAGHGEITSEFKAQGLKLKVLAIEKDATLIKFLKEKFSGNKNVEVIHGDALKILPKLILQLSNSSINYKIVGNIPFYITGRLMRVISQLKQKPEMVVFVIQKEVGQRICAKPPHMNILAASVQFWAEPEIIGYVSKKEFKPESEVDAAIIKLNILSGAITCDSTERKRYYGMIDAVFKQPRKTILNNLKHETGSMKHELNPLPRSARGIRVGLDVNESAPLILSNRLSSLRPASPVKRGEQAAGNSRRTLNNEEIIKKLAKIGINPQDRPQNLSIEQLKQLSTLF